LEHPLEIGVNQRANRGVWAGGRQHSGREMFEEAAESAYEQGERDVGEPAEQVVHARRTRPGCFANVLDACPEHSPLDKTAQRRVQQRFAPLAPIPARTAHGVLRYDRHAVVERQLRPARTGRNFHFWLKRATHKWNNIPDSLWRATKGRRAVDL